jgi:hypothetical protein
METSCSWKKPSLALFHVADRWQSRGLPWSLIAASCGGGLVPQTAGAPAAASSAAEQSLGEAGARTWLSFWFDPTDPRRLAPVRIATGLLGLALAASYAGDLETWFGPTGMIPAEAVDGWRPWTGGALLTAVTSPAGLRMFLAALLVALAAVTVGLTTRPACIAAALLWAALLNRGPMLAGPADDCLAVLLWCLAVCPGEAAWSLDDWIRQRRGRAPPAASPWAGTALGLLRVHAAAITLGVLLAQLKGEVWWNGTAAWWLAAGAGGRLVDPTPLYRGSEYLVNLVSHAIVAFEILFAAGLWFDAVRRPVCRAGLIAWPVVGLLAGEPFWGLAMAIFCLPWVAGPLGPLSPVAHGATAGRQGPRA